MGQIAGLIWIYMAGVAGYLALRFIRFPNPALLGAMFVGAAINIKGWFPTIPLVPLSFVANTVIGVAIARQIDGHIWDQVKKIFRYVLIQVIGMLSLSLACGWVVYLMTDFDLGTALISGSAGGIAEMMIFGASIDADIGVIAFIQVFRIIVFLALLPFLSIIGEKIAGKKTSAAITHADNTLPVYSTVNYYTLAVLATMGAAFGFWLRIPTGTMMGALLTGGAYSLFLRKRYNFRPTIREAAQVGLGVSLAARIDERFISQLASLFFPAIVVTIMMLVGCTLIAVALYKTSDWDLTTCLMCASPAGLSQVGAYADEVGADAFTATIFHTVRIVGIVTLYPLIIIPLISR